MRSADAIENSALVDTLCHLLEACNPWLVVASGGGAGGLAGGLSSASTSSTCSAPPSSSSLASPKWLGPLLLLLDLFEKVSMSSKRKAEVEKHAVSRGERRPGAGWSGVGKGAEGLVGQWGKGSRGLDG